MNTTKMSTSTTCNVDDIKDEIADIAMLLDDTYFATGLHERRRDLVIELIVMKLKQLSLQG